MPLFYTMRALQSRGPFNEGLDGIQWEHMRPEHDMPIPLKGLTEAKAKELLAQYGPNTIEEKKRSLFSRLWKSVASVMSLMFVAAGGLSLWAGEGSDAAIIGVLFLTNVGVGVWHEAKADNALEKLKEKLAVVVKTLRDGSWKDLPSAALVPGDVIELTTGSLIPADISFADARNVSVNEAVVTGESLPKEKKTGDKGYSGSFVSTGFAHATVEATGTRTYFGTTMTMVEGGRRRSQLEKDIISISRFLSIVSLAIMAVLTAVLLGAHEPLLKIATLDVSMLIAGIPVALPTVMTLIISVGIMELAKRAVIVRRLSSLEDLADVNLLLSDKTGTLSENVIKVAKMEAVAPGVSAERVWSLALAAAPRPNSNPLDIAIESKARELKIAALPVEDFIPGDSERKRTTAFVTEGGVRRAVSLGAPQTIRALASMDAPTAERYDALVAGAAKEGFRVLALAASPDGEEKGMRMLAVFFLADAIRADARETIDFMNEYGIKVKMVTGDGRDVAAHVAAELGLPGRIVERVELEGRPSEVKEAFPGVAGFAEVMPKDKYDVVMMARDMGRYTVAVTGDGVNDVPPVKAADVGIAVSNAVDALKGSADIVLTEPGISVIKDAIVEARKIFARLYNYSLYRISESFRLIVTIAVIGVIFGTYPLTPVQIILIALLNDIPIISLAFDRVAVSKAPSAVDAKRRFALSTVFGLTGIANSMILLWVAIAVFHEPWAVIQTLFFLKLTVSGHMLVYVAHTERPWVRFLPSKQVIIATILTQLVATAMSFYGFFTAPISWRLIFFVWIWSFFWMQIAELSKQWYHRLTDRPSPPAPAPAPARA
ncbi:MAG: plasma-membrane proton-efflux P-type ATPase [Patescibacteria group bacterium]|nr:plasma-membrane proton-efflux P-type ATPase [Patescibacteria group bacterium]